MATKNEYVPRVNQIDAVFLDKDVVRLIRDNLSANLQAISPLLFLKIQPEFELAIQSIIWFGSVGKQCSTFGQQLLILAYDSEQVTAVRLILHFAFSCLPDYIRTSGQFRISQRVEWFHKVIKWGEKAFLVLSLCNFFRFLKTGRKPTLLDFVLGLDYVSLRNNQRRDIGYKYLTRELIWGGFLEILGLVLPIINFERIQKIFRNALPGGYYNAYDYRKLPRKPATTVVSPNSVCSYCGERPTLPQHIFCEHIYCYFCLFGNMSTDMKFSCTRCGFTSADSGCPV